MIETRQILEEFQLKNVLATSPTGAVFLAGDPDSGRDVAIKMVSCAVPNAEDKVRDLFLEMVEAARSETIQSMPTLIDHGLTPEGDGFVVMELVEGQTLDNIEDLSVFAAVNILIDVLSCVEDLCRVGSAHLNLKPTNNRYLTLDIDSNHTAGVNILFFLQSFRSGCAISAGES